MRQRATLTANEYKKDVGTTCGSQASSSPCSTEESELEISSGSHESPEGATLEWCKERCDASTPCSGFEFQSAAPSRCWFRRETKCGRESNNNKDCYIKGGGCSTGVWKGRSTLVHTYNCPMFVCVCREKVVVVAQRTRIPPYCL